MSIDIDYDNPWIYNGKPFLSDQIEDNYGFVYEIVSIIGVILVGSISGHLENPEAKNVE